MGEEDLPSLWGHLYHKKVDYSYSPTWRLRRTETVKNLNTPTRGDEFDGKGPLGTLQGQMGPRPLVRLLLSGPYQVHLPPLNPTSGYREVEPTGTPPRPVDWEDRTGIRLFRNQ